MESGISKHCKLLPLALGIFTTLASAGPLQISSVEAASGRDVGSEKLGEA